MRIQMTERGLVVQREKGDAAAKRSGYSGGDGWSLEHHFMYMVKKALAEQLDINLVKVNAARDGHLMDDRLPILRPAVKSTPIPEHNIGIYHGNYMIESAAEDYNAGRAVRLNVVDNYLLKTK